MQDAETNKIIKNKHQIMNTNSLELVNILVRIPIYKIKVLYYLSKVFKAVFKFKDNYLFCLVSLSAVKTVNIHARRKKYSTKNYCSFSFIENNENRL